MDGICTLANDRVINQLIALLNSIEAILGKDTPVCVYPYDDNTEQIAAEIAKRPNVQLYDDPESIERWDNFAASAWDTHPTARKCWQKAGSEGYHRFGTHRRYCAFDGPFERFIYMDADTLAMGPIKEIFGLLDQYDCIVYDFQYKDPTHVYEVASPKLLEVFSQERLKSEIFCSGFYASKKDLFSKEKRNWLIEQLKNGEAEILYPMAPDQTLVNYMMMRNATQISSSSLPSICNLALHLPQEEKTGCCVTSPHFTTEDHILYDKGNRLTYLHYIGMSSSIFNRVCAGENINFPYRDIFLHYRYLSEPEKLPQFESIAKPSQTPSLKQKIFAKLGLK